MRSRWRATLLAWMLGCAAASAWAGGHCDIEWRITPRLDTMPRRLDVQMSFDGGARTESELQLPSAWAGVDDYVKSIEGLRTVSAQQRIVDTDTPTRKRILHRRGERVVLRFSVGTPAQVLASALRDDYRNFYRPLFSGDSFQFFGSGVLPGVGHFDDDSQPQLCVQFEGLRSGDWIVSSHGAAHATRHTFRVHDSPATVRQAFYLGGHMQVRERRIDGRPLVVVMHGGATSSFRFTPDQFADAVAKVIAAHRRFWRDNDFPYQLVALQPNHSSKGNTGGTAVYQAFAMHASDDFGIPGESFDFLVGHEHLHTWIPQRLGAMSHAEREDEALRYWFSEGFTDFYTHRLLVAAGVWTLDDYARTLNEKIRAYLASPARGADNARVLADFFRDREVGKLPYQRGEFLALRWHAALRAHGEAGLDEVMRGLLQSREASGERAARASEPLVVDRLFTALAPVLHDAPVKDVDAIVEGGSLFAFDADTLGPCFTMRWESKPVWQLGFDTASYKAMKLIGVDPEGPAYAAGLRDDQMLVGYSVYGGELDKDALIQWKDEAGKVRNVSYRPVARQPLQVPVYRAEPGALQTNACRAWFGLSPSAATVPTRAP